MKAVESVALFVFLVFFGACLEDDLSFIPEQSVASKSYPNVDQALWEHFEAFEDAAAARGFTIDLSGTNIYGSIEDLNDGNVVGTCSYGGRQNHKDVIIDASFWKRASSLSREYIVFHELGHCYLFRDHREACLQNRTWASIMRSGTITSCRDNYTAATREYYVDELMSPLVGP